MSSRPLRNRSARRRPVGVRPRVAWAAPSRAVAALWLLAAVLLGSVLQWGAVAHHLAHGPVALPRAGQGAAGSDAVLAAVGQGTRVSADAGLRATASWVAGVHDAAAPPGDWGHAPGSAACAAWEHLLGAQPLPATVAAWVPLPLPTLAVADARALPYLQAPGGFSRARAPPVPAWT